MLVAPHAVVIDHRTRSGSLSLYNPGDEPAEVSLSTFFGYPVTDSAGELRAQDRGAARPNMPSAAGWVEAFPKRMVLRPKERQTVRLLARPPAGLPDGEYWARLVVAAKGGTVPVSGVDDSSGVTVGLNLEVRTVLPLQYRKGAVATSVRLEPAGRRGRGGFPRRPAASRPAWAPPPSSAPFAAPSPTPRAARWRPSAARWPVYYDMEPRFTAALPGGRLPPGRYRLRVEVAAEREDLAPETLLAARPVRDSLELRLP